LLLGNAALGNNWLHFDEPTHTYSIIDGTRKFRVPSVTQVLEPLIELDGIPREALIAAGQFGTHVHSAVALMLNKQLEWKTLDTRLVPFVRAADKFVTEQCVTLLKIEHRMCDPDLKFAGAMDLLGVMSKYTCVIDWKTASVMPRTI